MSKPALRTVVCMAVVLAAACSSTTTKTGSSGSTSVPAGGSAKVLCADIRNNVSRLRARIPDISKPAFAAQLKQTMATSERFYARLLTEAPTAIRPDIETATASVYRLSNTMAKDGYDMTKLFRDTAAFSPTTKEQAAEDRVDKYIAAVCGPDALPGFASTTTIDTTPQHA